MVTSGGNGLEHTYPCLLLAAYSHHLPLFPGAWQTSTELMQETKPAENCSCRE